MERSIRFTDFDTHSHLPLVSKLIRSIRLALPRVGHYIILGKEPGGTVYSKPERQLFIHYVRHSYPI
jgi:hypothetical protein